jgi:hypothetical protein
MDDLFGFINPNVPRTLTPPAGKEAVHQTGMSWARQGDRVENTSWITVDQYNHIIAQFRGLAMLAGVDVSDLLASSPLLLRTFIQRTVLAYLSGVDVGSLGLMPKETYDADNDGLLDLAAGGTGVSATDAADLRDKLGVTAAIAAAINALVGAAPNQLDTINELAAALGDDANFAATVTAALAGKQASLGFTPLDKAGDTMTGGLLLGAGTAGGNPGAGKINAAELQQGGTPIATLISAAVGVGNAAQTWQDVKASRAVGTSYQNTTGKPIMVAVCANKSGLPRAAYVSADNSTFVAVGQFESDSPGSSVSFIVPDGWYYKIEASLTVNSWAELS